MFSRAFPSVQPQAELEWMSKRSLPCESLDDELHFCLSLCSLTHAVQKEAAVAEQKVEFMVRAGAARLGGSDEIRRTNSPFYSLVYRTLVCARMFVAEWKDVGDEARLRQLDILLGVMDFIYDACPKGQFKKMGEDMPGTLAGWKAAYLEMNLSAEWADRIANPNEVSMPLPAVAPCAKGINWSMWRNVHDATVLYRNGQYKAAHQLFTAVLASKQMWIPQPWVVSFLKPGAIKSYIDLPVPGAQPSTVPSLAKRRGLPPLTIAVEFV